MTTKDIRTASAHVVCDVCGRTLLRGEQADTYVAGGGRRAVCDLCVPRALNAGWVREGVALERGMRSASGAGRGRSLLGRLRRGREGDPAGEDAAPPSRPAAPRPELPLPTEPRQPRHVHAVPTSAEQRTVAALERFNASEHPRTVAGVARSLGSPVVVARSLVDDGLVSIVVSWELCWYRFEVDVADGETAVRPAGQGYELDELEHEDRVEGNVVADEYGTLAPA